MEVNLKGSIVLIDECDATILDQYFWCLRKTRHTTYVRHSKFGNLHRFILKAPKGMVVDHINGDGLDNRRCNLRICSIRENNRNCKKIDQNVRKTSSKYKGVTFYATRTSRNKVYPTKKNWRVGIKTGNTSKTLGYFSSERYAAIIYNLAALKYHGEYARINVVCPLLQP